MKKLMIWPVMAMYIFIISCSSPKETKVENEKFQIIHPALLDTLYSREYVADIHAIKNVEIRARVYGEISKIHVDEGQMVKKGQLLFSIEDYAYREELAKEKAQLKNAIAEARYAELEMMNTKVLVEKSIVSKTELERAEAKLEALQAVIEKAKSEEASAQLKLSFTQIKAPFDGIIDRIPLKMGSLVEEGTLLTTLSDNNEVFAYFNVSENEYLNFVLNSQQASEKSEVTLLLANATEHQYKGKVETIEGEFDKATGNISFRARFPNPKKILKHGSSGKISLKTDLKNALIIPQKSTFEVQDKTYVFIADSNNTIQSKNIIIKLALPHLYVIESGISEKDNILYEGVQRVKEDDKITPELLSAKKWINQQY